MCRFQTIIPITILICIIILCIAYLSIYHTNAVDGHTSFNNQADEINKPVGGQTHPPEMIDYSKSTQKIPLLPEEHSKQESKPNISFEEENKSWKAFGKVTEPDGTPVAGAEVQLWLAYYSKPEINLA